MADPIHCLLNSSSVPCTHRCANVAFFSCSYLLLPPPIRQGEKRGCPQSYKDSEAFAVSNIGIFAKKPYGDAGGDTNESCIETDGSNCFFAHLYLISFLVFKGNCLAITLSNYHHLVNFFLNFF